MTPLESFIRLAAVGVSVEGMVLTSTWTPEQKRTWDLARVRSRIEANVDTTPPTPTKAIGLMTMNIHNGVPESGLAELSDTHATALLCNAVLEKWPHWTVERGVNDLWYVTEWNEWEGGRRDYVSAPTRLAALTLAAEAKRKETPNG